MGKKKGKKKGGGSSGGGSRHSAPPRGGTPGQDVDLIAIAEREVHRATAAVAAEEYGEAIRHYSQGMMLARDNKPLVVKMLASRAAVWMLLRSPEDAATDLAVAVSLDRSCVRGWLRYAVVLWHLKKYPEAADCIRKGAEQIPPSDSAKLNRVRVLQEMMVERAPDVGELLMDESGMSDLEYDETQEEEHETVSDSDVPSALFADRIPPLVPPENYFTQEYAALTDANDESPAEGSSDATREKQLGNAAFGTGDFVTALRHYTRAILLDPTDHVFYSNRAATSLKLGRLHDAVSDCTTSVRLNPTIKAYARRAASWAAMREWTLAAQDYLSALRFEPRNEDIWLQLLNCFARREAELVECGPAAEYALRELQTMRQKLENGGPEVALTLWKKIMSL